MNTLGMSSGLKVVLRPDGTPVVRMHALGIWLCLVVMKNPVQDYTGKMLE